MIMRRVNRGLLAGVVVVFCLFHNTRCENSPPRRVTSFPGPEGILAWRQEEGRAFAASPARTPSPHRIRLDRSTSCPSINADSPEDLFLSAGLMSTKQVSLNIAAKLRIQTQRTDRYKKDDLGNELLTLVAELEGREQIREDQEAVLLKRLRELESQMQVSRETVEEQTRKMAELETRASRAETALKTHGSSNLQRGAEANERAVSHADARAQALVLGTNLTSLQAHTKDVMAKLETSRQKAWDAFGDFGALSERVHAILEETQEGDVNLERKEFTKQLQASFNKVSDLGLELEDSHASLDKHQAELEQCLHDLQTTAAMTEEQAQSKASSWISFIAGKTVKKSPAMHQSVGEMQNKRVATLRTALQMTLAHGHVDKDKASLLKAVNRLSKDASTTRRTCRLLRKWKHRAEVSDMRNIILKKKMENELLAVTTQLKDERARQRRMVRAREMEWTMAAKAVKLKNEMNATLQQVRSDLTAEICSTREHLQAVVLQAESNRTAAENVRRRLEDELGEARRQLETLAKTLTHDQRDKQEILAESERQLARLKARVQELRDAEEERDSELEAAVNRVQKAERERKAHAEEAQRREARGLQTVAWQSRLLAETRDGLEEWKRTAHTTRDKVDELSAELHAAQESATLAAKAREQAETQAREKIASLEARASALEREQREAQRQLQAARAKSAKMKNVKKEEHNEAQRQVSELEKRSSDLAARMEQAQRVLEQQNEQLESARGAEHEIAARLQEDLEKTKASLKEMQAQLVAERAEKALIGKEKDAAVAEAERKAEEMKEAEETSRKEVRDVVNRARKAERVRELEADAALRKEVQGRQVSMWQKNVLQETQLTMEEWKEAAERSISRLEAQTQELHESRTVMEVELQSEFNARQESEATRAEAEENIRLARTILHERTIMLRAATLAAQGNATKLEQVENELQRTKQHLEKILVGSPRKAAASQPRRNTELDAANARLKETEERLQRVLAEKEAADRVLEETKAQVRMKAQEVEEAERRGMQGRSEAIAAAKRARSEKEAAAEAMQRRAQSALQTVAWQASVLATAEERLEEWKEAAHSNMSRAVEVEARLETVMRDAEAARAREVEKREAAEAAVKEKEKLLKKKVAAEAARLKEKAGLEERVEALGKELKAATHRAKELEAEKAAVAKEGKASLTQADKTRAAAADKARAEMEGLRGRLSSELAAAQDELQSVERKLEVEMSVHKSLEAKLQATEAEVSRQSKRAERAEAVVADKQRMLEEKTQAEAAQREANVGLERRVEVLAKEHSFASRRLDELNTKERAAVKLHEAKSVSTPEVATTQKMKEILPAPTPEQGKVPPASARGVMEKLRKRLSEELETAKGKLREGEVKVENALAEKEAARLEKEAAVAEVERKATELQELEERRVREVAEALGRMREVERAREGEVEAMQRMKLQSKQTLDWQSHVLSNARENLNKWRETAHGNEARALELESKLETVMRDAEGARAREVEKREAAEAAVKEKEKLLKKKVAAEEARLKEKAGLEERVEALGKELKAATHRAKELEAEKAAVAKEGKASLTQADKTRAAAADKARAEMEGLRGRLSSELETVKGKLKEEEANVAKAVSERKAAREEKEAAVAEVERKVAELRGLEERRVREVAELLGKVRSVEAEREGEADGLRRREARAMQTVAWQSQQLSVAEQLVEEWKEAARSNMSRAQSAEAWVAEKERLLKKKVAAEAARLKEKAGLEERVEALGKELKAATHRAKELEAEKAAVAKEGKASLTQAEKARATAVKSTLAKMEELQGRLSSELETVKGKLKEEEANVAKAVSEREAAREEKEAAVAEVERKVAELLGKVRSVEAEREGEADGLRRREARAMQTVAWQSQQLSVAEQLVEEWKEAASSNMSRAQSAEALVAEKEKLLKKKVAAEAARLKEKAGLEERVEALGKELKAATHRAKELEAEKAAVAKEGKASLTQADKTRAAAADKARAEMEGLRGRLSSELETVKGKLKEEEANVAKAVSEREAAREEKEAAVAEVERKVAELLGKVRSVEAEREGEADGLRRREARAMQTVAWQSQQLSVAEQLVEEWKEAAQSNMSRAQSAEALIAEKERLLKKKVAAEAARLKEKAGLEERVEALGKELKAATHRAKELEAEKAAVAKEGKASLTQAEKARAAVAENEGLRGRLSSELATAQGKLKEEEANVAKAVSEREAAREEKEAAVAEVERKAAELRGLEERRVREVAQVESKLETVMRNAEAARAREVEKREVAEVALVEKEQELAKKVAVEAARLKEKAGLEERVEALGKELKAATHRAKELEAEKAAVAKEGKASLTQAEKARATAVKSTLAKMEELQGRLSSELETVKGKLKEEEANVAKAVSERKAAREEKEAAVAEMKKTEERRVREVRELLGRARNVEAEQEGFQRREARAMQTVAWQSQQLHDTGLELRQWKEAASSNMSRVVQVESKLVAAEAAVKEKEQELAKKVAAEAARLKEKAGLQQRVEALGRELLHATQRNKELESEKARLAKQQKATASLSQADQARAAAAESMRAEIQDLQRRLSSELETVKGKLKEEEANVAKAVSEREAAREEKEAAVVEVERKAAELRGLEERRVREVAELLGKVRSVEAEREGEADGLRRREARAMQTVAWQSQQLSVAEQLVEEWKEAAHSNMTRAVEVESMLETVMRNAEAARAREVEKREVAEVALVEKEQELAKKVAAEAARLKEKAGLEERVEALGKELKAADQARAAAAESMLAEVEELHGRLFTELETVKGKLKEEEANLAKAVANLAKAAEEREAAREEKEAAVAEVERKTAELRGLEEKRVKEVMELLGRARSVEAEREGEADGLRRREVRAMQTVAWKEKLLLDTELELREWKEAARSNMSRATTLELRLDAAARAAEADWFREVKRAELAEAAAVEAARQLDGKEAAEAARVHDQEELEKRVEALGKGLMKASQRCKELEAEKAQLATESKAFLSQAEKARAAASQAMRAEMETLRLRLSEQLNTAKWQLKEGEGNVAKAVEERETARREKEAAVAEVERKMAELQEAERKRVEDVSAAMSKVRGLQREKEAEADSLQRREVRAVQMVQWQSEVLADAERRLEEWRDAASSNMIRAAELESQLATAGQVSEAERVREAQRRKRAEAALAEKERELERRVAAEVARAGEKAKLEQRVEGLRKELEKATQRAKELAQRRESSLSRASPPRASSSPRLSSKVDEELARSLALLTESQGVRERLTSALHEAQGKLKEGEAQLEKAVEEREAAREEKEAVVAEMERKAAAEVERKMAELRVEEERKMAEVEAALLSLREEKEEQETEAEAARRAEVQLAQTMAWQSSALLGVQQGLDGWRSEARSSKKSAKQLRKRAMQEMYRAEEQLKAEVARQALAETAATAKVEQLERQLAVAEASADAGRSAAAESVQEELRGARVELAGRTAELEALRAESESVRGQLEATVAGLESKVRGAASALEAAVAEKEAVAEERDAALEEVEAMAADLKDADDARYKHVEEVLLVAFEGERESAMEREAARRREVRGRQTLAQQGQVLVEVEQEREEWKATAERAVEELGAAKAAIVSKKASLLHERMAHGRVQMLRNRLAKQTAHFKEQMEVKEVEVGETEHRIAGLHEQVLELTLLLQRAEERDARVRSENEVLRKQAREMESLKKQASSQEGETEDARRRKLEAQLEGVQKALAESEAALATARARKDEASTEKDREESMLEKLLGELEEMSAVSSNLTHELEGVREELVEAEQRVNDALTERDAALEAEQAALAAVEGKQSELEEAELRRVTEVGAAMRLLGTGERARGGDVEAAQRRETQAVQTVAFQGKALSESQAETTEWKSAFEQTERRLKKALQDYEVQMRLEEHRRHAIKASNARRCQELEGKLLAETAKRQEAMSARMNLLKVNKQVMAVVEAKVLKQKMQRIEAREKKKMGGTADSDSLSRSEALMPLSSPNKALTPTSPTSRPLLQGIAAGQRISSEKAGDRGESVVRAVGTGGRDRGVRLSGRMEERVAHAEKAMQIALEREKKLLAEQKWHTMAHSASEQRWKEMDARSQQREEELAEARRQLGEQEEALRQARAEKDALEVEKKEEEALLESLLAELKEMEVVSSRLGEELAEAKSQLARGGQWQAGPQAGEEMEALERKRNKYQKGMDSLRHKVRQMLEVQVEKVERERERQEQAVPAQHAAEPAPPGSAKAGEHARTHASPHHSAGARSGIRKPETLVKQMREMKVLAELGRSLSDQGDLSQLPARTQPQRRSSPSAPEAYDVATPQKKRPGASEEGPAGVLRDAPAGRGSPGLAPGPATRNLKGPGGPAGKPQLPNPPSLVLNLKGPAPAHAGAQALALDKLSRKVNKLQHKLEHERSQLPRKLDAPAQAPLQSKPPTTVIDFWPGPEMH